MKLVYYTIDEEKLFELIVNKLKNVDEKYIIKDVPSIAEETIKFLTHLGEEIFILLPYNDCEDFILKYFNHLDYFKDGDHNFTVGSLISHTIGRGDSEGKFLNMFREIYKTGKEKTGFLKYLNDDGKLLKYHKFQYFMMGDKLVAIHEDKTEVMMYRDSTLNDEDLGVAIIQNNRFVELNDNYASYVSKTRKQMLGQEQDLSGMPQETIEMIDREMGLIAQQKKVSYKAPIVSYDKEGNIDYYLNAEGSYIIYDNLPAVLIKIKDLTEQEKMKRLIEETDDDKDRLNSTLKEITQHSKLFVSYGNYKHSFVSNNFYDVIEDDNRTYPVTINSIRDFIIGDDLKDYDSLIASLSPTNPEIEFVSSIMTFKLNIKYIRHHIKRIYDSEGNIISYMSAHQDITDEATYSKLLKKHIFEKNEIIKNKDIQIKEAHHTIKNNLNILLSLIRMEEHEHKDLNEIMDDTKSHLKSISVMHEKLYQSDNLKDIELKKYIDSIVNSLFEIYESKIEYISQVDDIQLNSKQAGTLGLIINELINNTVKHAFPENGEGTVQIKISRIDKIIEVEYKDSGIGIPEDIDFDNPSSLGLTVIHNLTNQINGKIEYTYDNGSRFNIVINEMESF